MPACAALPQLAVGELLIPTPPPIPNPQSPPAAAQPSHCAATSRLPAVLLFIACLASLASALSCKPGASLHYNLTTSLTQSPVDLRLDPTAPAFTAHMLLWDVGVTAAGLCVRVLRVTPERGPPLAPLVLLQSPSGSVEEVVEHTSSDYDSHEAGEGDEVASMPVPQRQQQQQKQQQHRRMLLRGVVDLLSLRLHGDDTALADAPHTRRLQTRPAVNGSTAASVDDAPVTYTALHRAVDGVARALYTAAPRAASSTSSTRVWTYTRETRAGPSDAQARVLSHTRHHARRVVTSHHDVEFEGQQQELGEQTAAGAEVGLGPRHRSLGAGGGRLLRVAARGVAHLYGSGAGAVTRRSLAASGLGGSDSHRVHDRTLDSGQPLLLHGGEVVEETVIAHVPNGEGDSQRHGPKEADSVGQAAAHALAAPVVVACGTTGTTDGDAAAEEAACVGLAFEVYAPGSWTSWGLAARGQGPAANWASDVSRRLTSRRLGGSPVESVDVGANGVPRWGWGICD